MREESGAAPAGLADMIAMRVERLPADANRDRSVGFLQYFHIGEEIEEVGLVAIDRQRRQRVAIILRADEFGINPNAVAPPTPLATDFTAVDPPPAKPVPATPARTDAPAYDSGGTVPIVGLVALVIGIAALGALVLATRRRRPSD